MTFFHGIQVAEPTTGLRPILEKSTAIVGLIATATAPAGAAAAALDAAFPPNRPVLVTDVRTAAGAAGTGGTLAKALGAIADQGSPIVVVVRVAVGVAAQGVTVQQATDANVIGGAVGGQYTGMQALLAAAGQLGVTPRIIGAPGLDTLPVATALVALDKKLRGFSYVQARGAATVADATAYAGGFGDREVMVLWPEMTGWDGQAVATALGLRAMLDETIGWHKSISNVPVAGCTGLTKDVHFDIRDASSDAGLLNAGNVTTIVRANGYRFWGNRNCSTEPLFAFEVATRTAQAMQDAMADACRPFIDKPLTRGTVRDVEETANATLRRWTREGRIVGGRAWFDPALNPPESLSAGKLVLDYDYTADAPLEGLTLNQRITGKYYAGFGDDLATVDG